MVDYDDLDSSTASRSAREVVREIISDPLLVEMLFCPLMFYGSAREHDMDFAPVLHHVPQHLLWKGWPGRWPACG